MKWFSKCFSKKSTSRPVSSVRPTLEELEQRQVPTVTYHGGALLPHVEVQALYYGSDWYTNYSNYQQTGQIEGYLRYIVNSPYMDMLTNAGYDVGRGSFSQGRIVEYDLNKNYYLDDSTIQNNLLSLIRNGTLQPNDANRLYIVFVEPDVAVKLGSADSIQSFLGYHSAVQGVAYAVIPYQAGINASVPGLGAFDSLTEVTSHELAEGVTDPLTNGWQGWFDDDYASTHNGEGEIGDIVAGQGVRLNGYEVQKEAGKNDQPLSPVPELQSTTTTLTASENSIQAGQAVTFTATVRGSAGAGTPTGRVTFWAGATVLGTVTLDFTGTATFTTQTLPSGSYSVTAVYNGEGAFLGSTSAPVTVQVTPVPPSPGPGAPGPPSPGPVTPAPSAFESPALDYLSKGYLFGYYDYLYGSHSVDALYAYIYGYYAQVYAQAAASSHNATDWYYANLYGATAERYASHDYATSGNPYAYSAFVYDYYGSLFASQASGDEKVL